MQDNSDCKSGPVAPVDDSGDIELVGLTDPLHQDGSSASQGISDTRQIFVSPVKYSVR